ncbi:MAG: hypothetical protein ACT4N8_11860 [Sphingosinicella sp.]|uniref:hypothetical protein n=1 Tax=Sphingosinicella sp. TaxID=1917971 RepID=UPI0040381AA1
MAIALALLTATACARPEANEAAPQGNAAESNRVQTSGKVEVPLAEVPAEVLAAAQAARPGFVPAEAEAETREGRRYFDIEGRTAEGAEIEFDIMEENGVWRVVETQRDIDFAAAPPPVQAAARGADPALAPTRVIESVQADGLVIYEVYQGERKLEVRWNGRVADVLTREWAH